MSRAAQLASIRTFAMLLAIAFATAVDFYGCVTGSLRREPVEMVEFQVENVVTYRLAPDPRSSESRGERRAG